MSGHRDDGAGGRRSSSSAALSSPPHSSPEPGSPSAQLHGSIVVKSSTADADANHEASAAPQPPPRKKPGRKPKNAVADPGSAANTDAAKPKRQRKPKDPNAPPVQRKKKNKESLENGHVGTAFITVHPENNFRGSPQANHQPAAQKTFASENDAIQNSKAPLETVHSFFTAPPPPPPPAQPQQPQPVRTSGQNYDPIRSNYDPVRENVMSHNHYAPSNPQASPGQPPSMNRASASPSISSLVDPPNQSLASPSIATQSFFNQQAKQNQTPPVPPSPTANRLAPAPAIEPSTSPKPPAPPPAPATTAPKKADAPAPNAAGASSTSKKPAASGSTTASSTAASPKPPKLKDAKDTYPTPPPLPGSGLIQLGGPNDGTEFRAPTVILNIPMLGETNKYVNFTRLAEEQYGWDALHPRLAAQRDRLARVAAAGAALERNGSARESGDEMSLDSEGEGSNVEMGGMSDGRTGTDGGAKKVPRKRRMKEDEYDKDDGFVDDSELLWEEQAAAVNDGFFVYSGPLVQETEKPASDTRADGAPKRARGRGSRGGISRSSGRGGTAGGTGSRGGGALTGPGSRGGSTTRKPRITKAERARMEQEKLDREKMGGSMASMPNNYSAMPHVVSTANLGTTPMVFDQ